MSDDRVLTIFEATEVGRDEILQTDPPAHTAPLIRQSLAGGRGLRLMGAP